LASSSRSWSEIVLDRYVPRGGRVLDPFEQHRYAYELLGLDDLRELEVGAAAAGTSKGALAAYAEGVVDVLSNVRRVLRPARRWRSWSTTDATSSRTSSSGRGFGSSIACAAT
jgi:hypothetical protein